MKQESLISKPKTEEIRLTTAQKNNNPGKDGFWERFLSQAIHRLSRVIEGGDIYARKNTNKVQVEPEPIEAEPKSNERKLNTRLTADIKELLGDVPKGLKSFISEEELLLRALGAYKKEHGGFEKVPGLELKYKQLRKEKLEKQVEGFLEKIRKSPDNPDYDFDTISASIEEEVAKFVAEEGDVEQFEVEMLRQSLWDGFTAMAIK